MFWHYTDVFLVLSFCILKCFYIWDTFRIWCLLSALLSLMWVPESCLNYSWSLLYWQPPLSPTFGHIGSFILLLHLCWLLHFTGKITVPVILWFFSVILIQCVLLVYCKSFAFCSNLYCHSNCDPLVTRLYAEYLHALSRFRSFYSHICERDRDLIPYLFKGAVEALVASQNRFAINLKGQDSVFVGVVTHFIILIVLLCPSQIQTGRNSSETQPALYRVAALNPSPSCPLPTYWSAPSFLNMADVFLLWQCHWPPAWTYTMERKRRKKLF